MAELVAVRVTEDNLSKGSTTTGIVDYVLYNTTDVPMTLAVVEGSELGGFLSVASVYCYNRISG